MLGVCSVVRYSALLDSVKGNIRCSNALVVGANGTPLDVMGKITLSVRLGSFLDEHEFIIVTELTVECLLCADFMEKNDLLIDFRRKCLKLGRNDVEVSFIDSNSSGNNRVEDSLVTVSQAANTSGLGVIVECKGEGLIEDGKMEGKPNNVLVARSLCVLNDKCGVTVQVINFGPMPVTLYKGTRIAPRQRVFLLEDAKQCTGVRAGKAGKGMFRPDLQGSKLSTEEKKKLHGLLEEFSELFVDGELGIGRLRSGTRLQHLGHQFDNLFADFQWH